MSIDLFDISILKVERLFSKHIFRVINDENSVVDNTNNISRKIEVDRAILLV